jgi:hypothetical protein
MPTQPTAPADLPTILPTLLAMPRADKLRVIEVLASDLARQREEATFDPNATYEFWSPHDSYEAAAQLMDMLEKHKQSGAMA